MSARTLNDVFFSVIERDHQRVMLYQHDGQWVPISSRELYREVISTAKTLISWGIGKGDRVAILAENRPEWAIADYATMLIGAVVVPIYPTLTGEQIAWLLRDAGVRILFLSTAEQFKKLEAVRANTPVEQIVIMDTIQSTGAVPMQQLRKAACSDRDPYFDAAARAIEPDDLATIIYTSGTTGQQKGAMLSHGNLTSNVLVSLAQFPVEPGKEMYVSFLPLSHVTARHVDYSMFYRGITLAYLPDITKLTEALLQVRPTLFVGIPRVYEKIRVNVESKASVGFKRTIFEWALGVGRENRDIILRGETPSSPSWKVANKLLFSKVREGVGGRVKCFISGGAPLGRELAEWYADIGIRIHEGYGLTETSPVIAVNTPQEHRLGSVGKPLPNVEVRIADDGEILVRGPSVFKGYWNRPEETAAAFEGTWFKTGDIGNLDQDGFLSVTDRKKDLIKTSGGKFIAPQPIESVLKNHELVSEAAVLGDRRKFPAVVIRPEFEALELWARSNGVSFQTRDDLIRHPQVLALYEKILHDVNDKLAQFEKMKKFLLIPDDFTIANGFLTPTMKLRRRAIEEKYKREIEALYSEPMPIAAH
ncbi:MAG TPA: long-chain fatty acid--CoA ligase [Terriglobales bacterium]|nr:long-chain fatty acid--CoA ligase [Terriglobales bacterium]